MVMRWGGWWRASVAVVMVVTVVVSGEHHYQDDPTQPMVPPRYTARLEHIIVDNYFTVVQDQEWVYDGMEEKVAVRYRDKNFPHIIIMSWVTNQTVQVQHSSGGGMPIECVVGTLESVSQIFPVLYGRRENLTSEEMVKPEVLFGILNWTEATYQTTIEVRRMPGDVWTWCGMPAFEGEASDKACVETIWSAHWWQMPIPPSQRDVFPLSYSVVEYMENDTVPELNQQNNIMFYRPGVTDSSIFLIPQDLYCPGLVSDPDHPFPDFSKDKLFTFSLEIQQPGRQYTTWSDAWYDFEKQLYRIDHDAPLTPMRYSTLATILLDYNDGVAFNFVPGTIGECKVTLVSDTTGDWTELTGLDHLWGGSPESFFGLDVTNYTYYGPGKVRDMEGSEFRGPRSDWPPNVVEGNTSSVLWQWTFASKKVSTVTSMGEHVYVEKEVPIGVRITALQDIATTEGLIPKGWVYEYHIYDFNLETFARYDLYTDGRVFDAYDCYSANWRNHLRYQLDVSSWPEVVDTPFVSAAFMNEHWQRELATYGVVSPMRVTRVKTVVEEADEVWVEFVLLDRHPQIGQLDPDHFRNMTTGEAAKENIRTAISEQLLKYTGQTPDGESFEMVAVKDSLTDVIMPVCSTTVPPSTPSTTTTTTTTQPGTGATTPAKPTTTPASTATSQPPTPGVTTTAPDQNTNTGGTKPPTTTTDDSGTTPGGVVYSPGDLAGLGIGMLLVGLALGAGGTFLVVVKNIHHVLCACCFGSSSKA